MKGGKNMTGKFENCIFGFLLAGLCIALFFACLPSIAAGQAIDTSGPDRAYCISMGYLYTSSPGVNGGKGVCQFPDNSWCDAHSFFIGNCSANANIGYNPYNYNSAQGALDIADATKACQKNGGKVQNVHTSYGDVNLCVFPDGSTIDLRGLYNGIYGGYYSGPYNGYYNGPYSSYYNGIYGPNNWYYWAYSWLNAP
jgi:putative hemolysin